MNAPSSNRFLQIGRLAPWVLILTFVAEAGLRLVPIDRLSFRAWEAVRRRRANALMPFEPNRRYRNDHAYGDLGNLAVRPDLRELHQEIFTTDEFGFRNPPRVGPDDSLCALVAGSSLSAGSGVSDDQTLSAQLSDQLGCRVYNLAPCSGLEVVRWMARRLQMHSGVVFYEFFEREPVPKIPTSPNPPVEWQGAAPAESDTRPVWMISRLQILAQRVCRTVQNDRVLPRMGAPYVVSRQLRNGEPMLFLKDRLSPGERDASGAGTYFSWLGGQLAKDRLRLLVFLVPQKETIYRPLLNGESTAKLPPKDYLAQIEDQLDAAGIPVVNLEPVFRQQAYLELPRRTYLYLRDDSHWNAHGIATAAEAIAQVWRRDAEHVR